MAQWSLRTKLVVAAGLALMPLVGLAGWNTYRETLASRAFREEAVAVNIERAVASHRELIEGSRRLVVAACTGVQVRKSLEPTATTGDIGACGGYLGDVLGHFPGDYTSALVTDASGVARCSTSPSEVGMSFADRQIFRLVRERKEVSVGAFATSRVTSNAVIPMGVPLTVDGKFRGMCAVDISLQAFSRLAPPEADGKSLPVVLVDHTGAPVGGNAEMSFAMPVSARLATAINSDQGRFDDFGQNGIFYRFHVIPLAGHEVFAVAAIPVNLGMRETLLEVGRFVLIVLGIAFVLVATWLGADRWCVRPLRYIADFAGRVARGEEISFAPSFPWTQELATVGEGVARMAEAIASREADLKAGLEQRDLMLREIHHRVKNNLQMISSLLNLQAGEIRSPRIRRFFGDAQNRVLTLSILHRHLYERSSWSLVDFQQFISDLVRQISVSRPGIPRPSARYHIRAPIMAVGPDIAIPVGLIVTEAVGSALGHDFTSVASPEIRIEAVEKGGEEVELVIEDNGVDMARDSIGPSVRGTFGLTLIRGLAMQLGGEVRITVNASGGTRVVVTFPMERGSDA